MGQETQIKNPYRKPESDIVSAQTARRLLPMQKGIIIDPQTNMSLALELHDSEKNDFHIG